MFAEKVCRVCLNESSELKSLQADFNDEKKTILEILNFVANIDVKLENELPDKICSGCKADLELADSFKRRCLKSEADLGHYYYVTVKKEGSLKQIPDTFGKRREKSLEGIISLSTTKSTSNNLLLQNKNITKNEVNNLIKENYATTIVKREPASEFCDIDEQTNLEPDIYTDEYEKKDLDTSQNIVISTKRKKQNLNSKKSNTEVFSCAQCDKTFHKRDSYTAHLFRIHDPKNFGYFECSVCKKAFTSNYNYKKHLRTHRPKIKTVNKAQFSCNTCNKEFTFKSNLTKHLRKVHCGRITCKGCERTFPDQESLLSHKAEHLKDKYKQVCPICGITLKTNAHSLLTHMRRHQNIKAFHCNECEKSFVTKQELKVHSRSHTGAHPYLCNICGRGFTTSTSLQVHRDTIHSDERPHSCDLCPRTFKTIGAMRDHRRVHLSEKPYTCPLCAMAFRRNYAVIKHLRTHANDTPNIDSLIAQVTKKRGRPPVLAKTGEKDEEKSQET